MDQKILLHNQEGSCSRRQMDWGVIRDLWTIPQQNGIPIIPKLRQPRLLGQHARQTKAGIAQHMQ